MSFSLTRYGNGPILGPKPDSPWESLVVTNPGAWYDEESKQVMMLYRAAGNDIEHKVYFGLAVSKNGYDFERMSDEPVFGPSLDGFDAGCVEDPRIVKMGEWYYVTYAARPFPPGQYWLNEAMEYKRLKCPEDFPWILRENETATGLAMTKDFKTWIRAGRLTSPLVDDRDVILFPEKIGGKYYMLHRPMGWVGADYGTDFPAIWISSGTDLMGLENPKLLAKAEYEWECKVGGNTPPIKTEHGWLTIYHGVGKDKMYRLGALLLDLEDPTVVLCRTKDWILEPQADHEINGPYKGVVFPCGNVVIDGTFFLYYGGADKYVGVATAPMDELMDYVLSCPYEAADAGLLLTAS